MKQIKFRVWSKIKNTWVHNMMLLACIDGLPFAHFVEVKEDGDVKHHIYNASSLDVVIQQYTGLKDSNGKEIYEGDIIEEYIIENNHKTAYISEVLWSNHGWRVFHRNEYTAFELLDFDKLEIIGNIFENPELRTS